MSLFLLQMIKVMNLSDTPERNEMYIKIIDNALKQNIIFVVLCSNYETHHEYANNCRKNYFRHL